MHQQIIHTSTSAVTITENASNGMSIIFLHGNSLSSETFTSQFNSPLLGQFRLIGIDFPGHGMSEPSLNSEADYSMKGLARLTSEVITNLKLDRCVLVGHSLGGHVAYETLALNPKVIGVLAFGAPPLGMPPAMDKMFLPHPAIPLAFNGSLNEEEAMQLAEAFSGDSIGDEKVGKLLVKTDPVFRPTFGASLGAGAFEDECKILMNSKVPVCIVHGRKDKVINGGYFSSLDVPPLYEKRIHIIDNAGHMVQTETPQELNVLIERFVKYCTSRS